MLCNIKYNFLFQSALNSKLEKADILEMTVQYLENLNKNKSNTSRSLAATTAASAYNIGYTLCSNQTTRYLEAVGHFLDNNQPSSNSAKTNMTTAKGYYGNNQHITSTTSPNVTATTTCYQGNNLLISPNGQNINTGHTIVSSQSEQSHNLCNMNNVLSKYLTNSIPAIKTDSNSQGREETCHLAMNIKQEPCSSPPATPPNNHRIEESALNRVYDNISPVNGTVWRPW